MSDLRINGITFLVTYPRQHSVLLERCPKKRAVLGVGEWFVPGGKLEEGETELDALVREVREELGVEVFSAVPLPIVEGSMVPPGPRGTFLMRPFYISTIGDIPERTVDGGIELRWVPITEALRSPVPQVRMMVAALGVFA